MTLNLALVVSGDASGAKAALEETTRSVDKLKDSSGTAAENTKQLGENLKDTGAGGEAAAKGIGGTGDAAVVATGRLGGFAASLGRIATFVGGTIMGAALGGVIGIGLGAITSALAGWFASWTDKGPGVADLLKTHKDLIGDIAQSYKDAANNAKDYGLNSAAARRFEAQRNVAGLQEQLAAAGGINLRETPLPATPVPTGLYQPEFAVPGLGDVEPFVEAIKEFNETVRAGAPDVNKFRNEVAAIAAELAQDSPYQKTAEELRAATKEAGEVQAALGRARDMLKGLEGDEAAAEAALGKLPKGFTDAGEAAERQAESIRKFREELEKLGGGAVTGGNGILIGTPGTAPAMFASGGIVTSPTLFRFGAGQLGLMGEAGAEAILPMRGGGIGAVGRDGSEFDMPLARLASGKLGVKAFAGGGVIGQVTNSLSNMTRAMIMGEKPVDALAAAIGQLGNRLLDIGLDTLFGVLQAGLGLGGGGGGLGKLFGFASGGVVTGRSAIALPAGRAPIRFAAGGTPGRSLAPPSFAMSMSGGRAPAGVTIVQHNSFSSNVAAADRAWIEARLAQNKQETLAAMRDAMIKGRQADPNYYGT